MKSIRYEFKTAVKKAALARSGGVCEARGTIYGLEPETRCTVSLVPGKYQIDHWPLAADVEGSDVLENAVVCCLGCHARKTAKYDIPMRAKSKRIRRSHGLIPDLRKHQPKKIPARPFPKGQKTKWASMPFNQREK